MSAYIVTKEHIDAMVRLANAKQVIWRREGGGSRQAASAPTETDQAGQMLLDQNVKSVEYRYPQDRTENLPGPMPPYWQAPYRGSLFGRMPTPVEGLKLIHCYEYQSCEDPAWELSEAHEFCRVLSDRLISDLPGYDEAPWGWSA